MSDDILECVERALSDAGLGPGGLILVGLSGGADSLALAHLLTRLWRSGVGPLPLAVHVDHGLRPESAAEAEWVRAMAGALGIEPEIVPVDVDAWRAEDGRGVEAAARAARYGAFAAVAARRQCSWLALAHQRDDQVETLLLRLLRGASLDGLTGMHACAQRTVRLAPTGGATVELRLLRPLLEVSRAEIERYLADHDLRPLQDPSNQAGAFRRNRVRHELLPLVDAIAPGARRAIERTGRLLADDAAFLQTLASSVAERLTSTAAGLVFVQRVGLRSEDAVIQRRVLVRAITAASIDPAELSTERLEALRLAAGAASTGAVIELGRDLVARIDYNEVAIGCRQDLDARLRALSGLPLLLDADSRVLPSRGEIELGNGFRLCVGRAGDAGWRVRRRRPGDRLRLGERSVRLQDWFVNRKVPIYLRDWLPLLSDRDEVRWVVGLDGDRFRDDERGVDLWLEARKRE